MPAFSFSSLDTHPPHISNCDNESTEMLAKPYDSSSQFPMQYSDKDAGYFSASNPYSQLPTSRRPSENKSFNRTRFFWKKRFTMQDVFFWRKKKVNDNSPRIIYVNNPEMNLQQKFVGNRVSTAKYNIFTFLPIFLYVEFSKAANIFFLFISCIQVKKLYGGSSPYRAFLAIVRV